MGCGLHWAPRCHSTRVGCEVPLSSVGNRGQMYYTVLTTDERVEKKQE